MDAKEKERREMLVDLYKANQEFLNKAIFSISSLSIPLLIQLPEDFYKYSLSKILISVSLIGFICVVCLQIFSLKSARDGCDYFLNDDSGKHAKGWDCFTSARNLNNWREMAFIISLLLIAISLSINLIGGFYG